MKKKPARDVERTYPLDQFISKLRRLADGLETGKRFVIQIARERIAVPARAIANVEHEREGDEEEIEFQLKWRHESAPKKRKKKSQSRVRASRRTRRRA